jgi:peptidoglycan hydrolase-like protein with peptidoglycan-binding domain
MAVNQSYGIKAAVGAQPGAVNNPADVEIIQRLLNEHATKVGYPPLTVNGVMTPQMIQAIRSFQQKVVGMKLPDGRVDPSGGTLRKLNGPPSAAHPPAKSRVSGKTAGVKADIIAYLEAVADHYGKDIVVVSGKRDLHGQAQAMWDGWGQHLDRGKIYTYLMQNETVRRELDNYYVLGVETPGASASAKQQAKHQFFAKIASIGQQLSRHLTGEAVDVSLSTDAKVLAALKVGLRYLPEKHKGVLKCHHFDNSKLGKVPELTPQHKAQWPS